MTAKINLENIIIIGDRVLIKSKSPAEKTKTGLYLPPGVHEKEIVHSGYVMKTGPGYPMPIQSDDESWKRKDENIRYIPLQVREGDLAIFLQKDAFEVVYENEIYFVVPQHSILMLERDESLFS